MIVSEARWHQAQATEPDFWAGVAFHLPLLLRVLADNSAKAKYLSTLVDKWPLACLEVGIGPLGMGVIGFLPEIANRVGLDPAEPVILAPDQPLHQFIKESRISIQYIVASGENIPLADNSMEMVVCCNVVDHALNPGKVFSEIHRVLRTDGFFFFDVDTFSLLGLFKWYAWTRPRHREELLVQAHTYRMFEPLVRRELRLHGFEEVNRKGHTPVGLIFGHARESTFLLRKKRLPKDAPQ